MKVSEEKILVFDADVLIHFMQAECFSDLRFIFPNNQKVILQKVFDELQIYKESKRMLESAITTFRFLSVIPFPQHLEMMKEYAHLTSSLMDLGKGESACLSYCKFTNNVVVSSNLSDVRKYCNFHKIELLTTLDLVSWAFENSVWNEQKCNEFIQTVIKKNGKIPNIKISEYKK